jgi:hypothetical protein
MNAVILNNVAPSMNANMIKNLLHKAGIMTTSNIVDFLNNPNSKTVMIEVLYWHDTECAYQIIRDLKQNEQTEIKTFGVTLQATLPLKNEEEPEQVSSTYAEDIDAYLEQMDAEDKAIWMRNYDRVSYDDELSREESYMYLNLRNYIV